jgi:serine protease Do
MAPCAEAGSNESASSGSVTNFGKRWLRRFGRFRVPDKHERNHPQVRAAFREVVQPASQYTVRVLSDEIQVALGTIVRSDGYILTKASELGDGIECLFSDGRKAEATLVAVHQETDLALLKVAAGDLPAVEWSDTDTLPIGSWLATAGLDATPTAIGVLSAPPRAVPQPRAVLGVLLEDARRGALISRVLPRSPAAKAGLQSGDVVVTLDGKHMIDRDALIEAIRHRQPGDQVKLSVTRDDNSIALSVTLGNYSHAGNSEQAELMESLGGELSDRRAGFQSVLQHDTVLRPRDCGGPVVDLDGNVVGINIARASRVSSYALPVSSIKPVLADLMPKSGGLTQVDAGDETLEPVSVGP